MGVFYLGCICFAHLPCVRDVGGVRRTACGRKRNPRDKGLPQRYCHATGFHRKGLRLSLNWIAARDLCGSLCRHRRPFCTPRWHSCIVFLGWIVLAWEATMASHLYGSSQQVRVHRAGRGDGGRCGVRRTRGRHLVQLGGGFVVLEQGPDLAGISGHHGRCRGGEVDQERLHRAHYLRLHRVPRQGGQLRVVGVGIVCSPGHGHRVDGGPLLQPRQADAGLSTQVLPARQSDGCIEAGQAGRGLRNHHPYHVRLLLAGGIDGLQAIGRASRQRQ
mmetsp:Transcript_22879/g.60959  ORF Transcript_22879/g.60959 Transcript_22879/m.60959 type:complete len:274 (+) Transcript_22879:924-1745(+)